MLTKLDVVNAMLATTGQYPITDLQDDNPQVSTCLNIIDRVLLELYSQKWYFCTETTVLVPQNNTGIILVPEDFITFITPSDRYIVRNGKVYDKITHTDKIGHSITVTYTRKVSYEELPPAVHAYIVAACRYEFQADIDADPNTSARLAQAYQRAKSILTAEQIRQNQTNIHNLDEFRKDRFVRYSGGYGWRYE